MEELNYKISGVNWNKKEDEYTQDFLLQNLQQFWIDKEFAPKNDDSPKHWGSLSEKEKDTYIKVLAGLTLLDTEQGGVGMPLLTLHAKRLQSKGVLAFMGAMEEIHAKSYSTIFTTLISDAENEEAFKWAEMNRYLQYKAKVVHEIYFKIFRPDITLYDLYIAMVASVFLESYLFYSGFFFPLYLAGQGRMVASGEIINLILRDESIHGVYVGLLAQEVFEQMTDEDKERAHNEVYRLLFDLMANEEAYTEDLYAEINLDHEVKKFIKYNANKALMNLGYPAYYEGVTINPIVENGLSTETKNHDFFSTKGNGYVKAIYEPIREDDFKFDWLEEK
jgi:ribonucleoside-diphosphate reductase beta chain